MKASKSGEPMYHISGSLRQMAAHFNISFMDTARNWEQIYCEKNKEDFYEENKGSIQQSNKIAIINGQHKFNFSF